MKKLSLYIFLVLMWCNVAHALTRHYLPKCEGNDYKKWTNCFGSYTSDEGRKYTGEFGNEPGKRHGMGTAIQPNGNKYKGEYENDKPKGKGIYSFPNGRRYVGEVNGIPNGIGIEKFPRKPTLSGDQYIGQFKNGKPDGQGAFILANGQIIKGEHKDGKLINDQSLPQCDRKKSFQTYNNCQHLGMYYSPTGDKYGDDPKNFKGMIFNGEFQNGKLNGFGLVISTLPNEEMEYIGELKNGYREGFGSMTFINGSEYVGYFKKEVWHGEGVLIHPDEGTGEVGEEGLVFFGNFKNGKENGQGTLIIENGDIIRGIWKNGEFIKED